MHNKIIFCDIDGTLINHHGSMPSSAKEAIKIARANGHLVFLCTGRSKAEVVGDAAEIEVDGRICSAGGYVEVENEVIRKEYIDIEHVKHLVSFLDANEVHFCLEAIDKTYVSGYTCQFFREIMEKRIKENPDQKEKIEKLVTGLIEHMIDDVELERDDICKALFFGSSVSFEELEKEFKDEFIVLQNSMPFWGGNSGEMMIPGVHKASGIQYALKHLGYDKEDTFAYGDSLNDMEMIEFVKVGVAMGNACESLKQIADDITDTVDEDGIYKSFKKYGLI